MNDLQIKTFIQKNANQCVKCGLCLPHCPTYMLTKNECESPRGRIAIMEGLASDQLPLTDKLQNYLDHCLTCRACESVCPAQVPYGELIDHTRMLLAPQNKKNKTVSIWHILKLALAHPWLWRWLGYLLRLYQRSGLQWLMRKTRLLNKLHLARPDALLPKLGKTVRWRRYYPAVNQEIGRVALFVGCINNFVDQPALQAAIQLLTACGYGVYIPSQQRCCGALHQHSGEHKQAQGFAARNLAAFKKMPIAAVITVASGCTVMLKDYARYLDLDAAPAFSATVINIHQFLAAIAWPSALQLMPSKQRIAVHMPCTLDKSAPQMEALLTLLRKIPGVELMPLATKAQCCGAAGLYMLQQAEMADNLLKSILQQVEILKPDCIVTANIGCQLHIARELRLRGCVIPVVHPVLLLAAQLKNPPPW
jgi:glycolate oxidase iron-sulfur subunit